jgi:hypothetical protein
MNKKYFVISNSDAGIHKVPLKKWWRLNERDKALNTTRDIFFELVVNREWKCENLENEVILMSNDLYNDQHDTKFQLDQTSINGQSEKDDLGQQTMVSKEFGAFIKSYKKLKDYGLLRNQKDITGQLGEWLASEILGAKISLNGINKDWDLIKEDEGKSVYYQVKAHAKSDSTNARWTRLEYSSDAQIHYLVIVVFSQDYALREFYKVPFHEAIESRTDGFVLNWSKIRHYNVIENYKKVLLNKNLGFILE